MNSTSNQFFFIITYDDKSLYTLEAAGQGLIYAFTSILDKVFMKILCWKLNDMAINILKCFCLMKFVNLSQKQVTFAEEKKFFVSFSLEGISLARIIAGKKRVAQTFVKLWECYIDQ